MSPDAKTFALAFIEANRCEMLTSLKIIEAARTTEWMPSLLHPIPSWTHYRPLMRVSSPHARPFYEIEAIQQNWTARELVRQINTLLFERLAKSRDKKGVMKLATKGREFQQPDDVFKDTTPFMLHNS